MTGTRQLPTGPPSPEGSRLGDAARLAFGTLTVLPVTPPTTLDRRTAGSAMLLAPLAAVVLAVPVGLALALLDDLLPPLLLAVAATGALAVLTRALHLDGLADTADGLGSNQLADGALDVMRRSDVGPFGVVTLVLVLLMQVAALAACLAAGLGAVAVVAALLSSRALLPLLCTPAWPAARPEGLGATVAGTVRDEMAFVVVVSTVLVGLLGAISIATVTGGDADAAALVGVLGPLGIAAGLLLARHCRTRFGGISGDVLGAAVETAYTVSLVVAAVVATA